MLFAFIQDGSYVLPLLWRGTPVKMTCPVSPIEPQAVGPSFLCCSLHGMTVKVHEKTPLEEQRVNGRFTFLSMSVKHHLSILNLHMLSKMSVFIPAAAVRGEWTPLALLVERCGYTLDKQDADTVIAAPFITCGITEKVSFRRFYTQERLEQNYDEGEMNSVLPACLEEGSI